MAAAGSPIYFKIASTPGYRWYAEQPGTDSGSSGMSELHTPYYTMVLMILGCGTSRSLQIFLARASTISVWQETVDVFMFNGL